MAKKATKKRHWSDQLKLKICPFWINKLRKFKTVKEAWNSFNYQEIMEILNYYEDAEDDDPVFFIPDKEINSLKMALKEIIYRQLFPNVPFNQVVTSLCLFIYEYEKYLLNNIRALKIYNKNNLNSPKYDRDYNLIKNKVQKMIVDLIKYHIKTPSLIR